MEITPRRTGRRMWSHLPANPLGREYPDFPARVPSSARPSPARGYAEIGDFHRPVAGHQDIRRDTSR